MGLLSLFKNLNLPFGMGHSPTTTSAVTTEAKEFKEVEQDNKMQLAGDHHEISGVDKDARIRSDVVSCHGGNMVFIGHPQKLSVPNCSYYLQTGSCTFGTGCKFNHPSREENVEGKPEEAVSGQGRHGKFKGLGNNASSENVEQIECKFYLLPGGCKYVHDCRFLHHVQLNFLGLPIRPGEKTCPFYKRTGGCKFASRCRYHHPDPTAVDGEDSFQDRKNGVTSQQHGPVEQFYETPWPSENTSNEQTGFLGPSSYNVPGLFTPNLGFQPNVQWNGNQENVEGKPEQAASGQGRHGKFKGLGNNASSENVEQIECKLNFLGLPIRPGEKTCHFYMRTGGCKFASSCRYHHPDPTAVDGEDSFQDRKNGATSQQHGPVEQFCETPWPLENTSNEQTGFLCPSSYNVPGLFTPNLGFQPNVLWNGNQTVTSLLHPREIKIIDQQQELANKDATNEFSGAEPQQFDEYPQRPSEPECQYFMKTGYCKFKGTCRYHHPKSNLSFLGVPLRSVRNNYEHDGPVEQLCETPLPSENTSNEHTAFLGQSSSYVPGLFTPNQGLQPQMQWNGDQTATNQLHPREMNINDQRQALANKDTAHESSGGVESQQFDEYPQRPSEPECQYFLKTGYCKFKSACRNDHPKSNPSFLGLPTRPVSTNQQHHGPVEQVCETTWLSENTSNEQTAFLGPSSSYVQGLFTPNQGLQPNVEWNGNQDKPICTYYRRHGICKFGSSCRYNHHMQQKLPEHMQH